MESTSLKRNTEDVFSEDFQLENDVVILRPIALSDMDGLRNIAFDDKIWTYFTAIIRDDSELRQFIDEALDHRKGRIRAAFVLVERASGQIAGSSSFGNFSFRDKRVEIGWSWLAPSFQRTGINRNAKFLLMQYAFETLGFERVEFKTDVLNLPARKGLLGIGATEEGVLRSHTLMPFNRRRDTIYYSVLQREWPEVKSTVFKNYRETI